MANGGRARVRVEKNGIVWGEGDELLDGTLYFTNGQYLYETFRGKRAKHERLSYVLTAVAKQLGYTSAVKAITPRATHG